MASTQLTNIKARDAKDQQEQILPQCHGIAATVEEGDTKTLILGFCTKHI